jgi:IMP dehydrogenase
MRETIAFDDVLLEPQYSDIKSRSEVDIGSNLGKMVRVNTARSEAGTSISVEMREEEVSFALPIISSPMDTVTEDTMAAAMANAGGLGIIHRYNDIGHQAALSKSAFAQIKSDCSYSVSAAIGATGDYMERAKELHKAGVRVFCIDVAHGHHTHVKEALFNLKQELGNVHLMAGNVATLTAFKDLENWGADSVRVGIGGGSICSTRIRTGHGIPTLQSIFDCASVARTAKVIADGGFKKSGDIVKALAAGADFVVLGSMLAGTDETPGEVLKKDGKLYKKYRGMASEEAQLDWRGRCSVSEGICATVPYRGKLSAVLEEIEGGVRSGFSYSGARNISELRARARFLKQTASAQVESNTHILYR